MNASYDLWAIAKKAGALLPNQELSPFDRHFIKHLVGSIFQHCGYHARTSADPTVVAFGTSGWRDAIGAGFTADNVRRTMQAIASLLQSNEYLSTNGFASFEELKKAGVLVQHDNRYMGLDFSQVAFQELTRVGIKVYYAGQCPTGVGSAVLRELGGAASVNFTPSHNTMEYAGLKFNPRDGGPADVATTDAIQNSANELMKKPVEFTSVLSEFIEVNPRDIFLNFIQKKSKVFDLALIREKLKAMKNDLHVIVDYTHGSARGFVETLLGEELASCVEYLRTEDDVSFGGMKPEPSPANQARLVSLLQKSPKKLTLAVAMDPDADRIRFCDATLDMDMNKFSSIAWSQLLAKGIQGGLATTVASSAFPGAIALAEKRDYWETQVGFKNFRPYLGSGKAAMAFEESDGISFTGHTLEKCALAGFLSALQAVLTTGKNLSELYRDLQKKYGYYYSGRSAQEFEVKSVSEWLLMKGKLVSALKEKVLVAGASIELGGSLKKIERVDHQDGPKAFFEDGSWILVRPSGTEMKVRYYYEVTSKGALIDANDKLQQYETACGVLLDKAREIVG